VRAFGEARSAVGVVMSSESVCYSTLCDLRKQVRHYAAGVRAARLIFGMVAAIGAVLTVMGPALPTAAQLPFPTTTFEPFPTTEETAAPAPSVTPLRPAPTTITAPVQAVTTSTEVRRSSTTTSEPPTSTIATIAPAPGGPGVADTTPPDRTRPGEGDMPSWPLWLFGLGAGGTVSMMAGQFVRTKPRRWPAGLRPPPPARGP
jgi:hypothetical protein